MKRLLFSTFFFLMIAFNGLLPRPSLAQERLFDFDRAYQDYLYNYNQYHSAYKDYLAAKSAYLTYQTLTAKTEALDKTLTLLQIRDEVVRTYTTALRLKLAETTGISNYEQTLLYLKLDNEVAWYLQHRDSLSSAGSPEDLLETSEEAEDQYRKTEVLAYQTLGTILAGKENDLRNQLQEKITEIKDKIAEIRQKGDKETDILERWLLEAENKLTRSQEKEFAAQQKLSKLKPSGSSKQEEYHQARILFQESHQYLKEAHSYLKEIIREVKNAD